MSNNFEHWSETWEATVSAVLAEQDSIQADIDENLRHGDLIGAASSSFEHVITSYALGDQREASAYLMAGMIFAQAEMALMAQSEEPASVLFQIPQQATCEPHPSRFDGAFDHERGEWVKTETFYQYLQIQDKLVQSVAATEAILLLGPDADPCEINNSVNDGVVATCDMIFTEAPTMYEKRELLSFAKRLSKETIFGMGEESDAVAVRTFERLMFAALCIEGSTFSTLNHCTKAFTEIKDGDVSEHLTWICNGYVDILSKAKRQIIARESMRHVVNTARSVDLRKVGGGNYGPYINSRPYRSTQEQARLEYKLITDQHALEAPDTNLNISTQI